MFVINEKINSYIRDILNASNNGNLVFFIGAGVSTLSDYPQWWQLVDKFYRELYNDKKNKYDSDDLLRVPQIYFDVKGKERFDEVLKETFQVQKEPNKIHDKILSLDPKHIITTNYDNLIEHAISNRGKKFSIVSQEGDLSNSISARYLLKIHGDFKNGYNSGNIVLKENDYLNYDQNYPLISNIMKTIIATHTIVFIGYGLGDYNINILLNWVKTLQKDSFNKPVFIRTNPQKISQEELVYYENKSLKIIDAASLFDEKVEEYMPLYSRVMDLVIESSESKLISNDNEAIEYIYKKTSPLFPLNYIRTVDFNELFERDYVFNVTGTIDSRINNDYDYLDSYFEICRYNFKGDLSSKNKVKAKEILSFFNKNGIKGMAKHNNRVDIYFEINNLAFESEYEKMEEYVAIDSQDITYNYKKAFYLAHLGRWEEAYYLYSNLILKTVSDESNWWIYYLSQINRYRIYQSINQLFNSDRNFESEFLERIRREMKNFNIEDLFDSMSFGFKKKYEILNFLSSNLFLYEDTVQLFNSTNKVRLEMSKNSLTFGISSEDKITLSLYDNLRFLYENFLWVVEFNESKQYIKNSITLLIEKANYENNRESEIFDIPIQQKNSNFELDYYYFISITKNFRIDDIKYLEQSVLMEKIEVSESKEIEEYLVRLAEKLIANFPKKGMSRVFYGLFIEEVQTAFYLARYIKLSEHGLIKIIQSMLFHFPGQTMDVGTCYLRINSLGLRSEFTEHTISVIEKFLYQQAVRHAESNFSENTVNGFYSTDFLTIIKYFDQTFVSEKLSKFALSINPTKENQVNYMYHLYPILNTKAKEYVLKYFTFKDVKDINNAMYLGIINELSSSHMKIIYEYLQIQKMNHMRDMGNGIKTFGDTEMRTIGIWYFVGELKLYNAGDYVGIDDEYDFFVQGKEFDFKQRFNSSWLKKYNKKLLKKISENTYIKQSIRDILKVDLPKSKDNKLLNILLEYFL